MTLLYKYETLLETELGKIIHIPLVEVQGSGTVHPALLKNLAIQIQRNEQNFLPVIVKLLEEDSYEAVYNIQILEAARTAKVDFIWCIVVNNEILEQIRVESGEIIRISALKSSETDIIEVFDYIKEQKSGMRTLDSKKAAKAIIEKRSNAVIKSLNFLTREKCGIGKITLEKIKPYFILG